MAAPHPKWDPSLFPELVEHRMIDSEALRCEEGIYFRGWNAYNGVALDIVNYEIVDAWWYEEGDKVRRYTGHLFPYDKSLPSRDRRDPRFSREKKGDVYVRLFDGEPYEGYLFDFDTESDQPWNVEYSMFYTEGVPKYLVQYEAEWSRLEDPGLLLDWYRYTSASYCIMLGWDRLDDRDRAPNTPRPFVPKSVNVILREGRPGLQVLPYRLSSGKMQSQKPDYYASFDQEDRLCKVMQLWISDEEVQAVVDKNPTPFPLLSVSDLLQCDIDPDFAIDGHAPTILAAIQKPPWANQITRLDMETWNGPLETRPSDSEIVAVAKSLPNLKYFEFSDINPGLKELEPEGPHLEVQGPQREAVEQIRRERPELKVAYNPSLGWKQRMERAEARRIALQKRQD